MSPSVAGMLVSLVPLWMAIAWSIEVNREARAVGLKFKEFPYLVGAAVVLTGIQAAIVVVDVMGYW